MARPRTIADATIFAAILRVIALEGDGAVTFGAVARATGLAAATLAQRFGTRDGMLRAALIWAWDGLEQATEQAAALSDTPQGFLKALTGEGAGAADLALLAVGLRDPLLRSRAEAWRARVEAVLALHLGRGAKGQEAAALLFAAWQGQQHWQVAGGRGFRLKDAARRLE